MTGEIISFNTQELAKVKPVLEQPDIPVFALVQEDAEILTETMPEFDFVEPPVNPNQFASSLVETCRRHNGLGLSANQCGFRYRVFVAGAGDNYVAYFNPKVINMDKNEQIGVEGCLSFPNLFLNILRPNSVEVEYQDFKGDKHIATFSGMTARVFLHELDHMNGITFTRRAKPLALKSGFDKREKLVYRMKRATKSMERMVKGQKR